MSAPLQCAWGCEGEKRQGDKTDFRSADSSNKSCDMDDELCNKWSTFRNVAKGESVLGVRLLWVQVKEQPLLSITGTRGSGELGGARQKVEERRVLPPAASAGRSSHPGQTEGSSPAHSSGAFRCSTRLISAH